MAGQPRFRNLDLKATAATWGSSEGKGRHRTCEYGSKSATGVNLNRTMFIHTQKRFHRGGAHFHISLVCSTPRFITNRAYLGWQVGQPTSLVQLEAWLQQLWNEMSQDITRDLTGLV
ncbi:hypothetical protein TNCV_4338911 [Trichonephila clavipes]|nr:hypothetical protein TNCV_4338911 [Trichonephila clavipes]